MVVLFVVILNEGRWKEEQDTGGERDTNRKYVQKAFGVSTKERIHAVETNPFDMYSLTG